MSDDGGSNGGPAISPTVVVCVIAAIVLGSLSAGVYLIGAGRSAESVIGLLSAIAIPTITGLFALVKIDRVQQQTETIKRQTNGALGQIQDRLTQVEQIVPVSAVTPTRTEEG